tara:strand:- start:423 stop:650 length:228 start_codon:yes stop_codon:yes gene_type:complete
MKMTEEVDMGLKALKYRFLEKIKEKVDQDEPLSASDINAVYAVLKDANLGFTPEDVMPVEQAMDFNDLPFPLPEE